MSSEQQTQQKQKYLRQNIDPDDYEDFADFFMNEAGTEDLDISKFKLQELQNIVEKFNLSKVKEAQQQKHERSFAIYQTADIQNAYNVLSAVQKDVSQFQSRSQSPQPNVVQVQPSQIQVQSKAEMGQNLYQTGQVGEHSKTSSPTGKQIKSPEKPNYQSASDLLDSVLASSQEGGSNQGSPQGNSNNNAESKYRSNSQISIFQKGNIWATTANIQNQPRKSAQFDTFWQFSSNVNATNTNAKKQQYKTENPFANQAFDFTKPIQQQTKPSETKKTTQSVPSFEELTKNINMTKKPNTYGSVHVQPPSNMKKQQTFSVPVINSQQQNANMANIQTNSHKNNNPTSAKQIKLIAQKPINQQSLSSLSNVSNQQPASVIKMPTSNLASAYKNNKIPYKGPTVHKSDFKDVVKCYEASIRTQLSDPRLQIAIEKHEIVEKNFFVGDYVMYYMTVRPLNIVCKRNYEDFTKLKTALQKFYPGMQLPWLQKNSWFETNAENIKKQKVMLEFFINDLIKNPEIRNSRIFEDFLTLKDHKAIKRKFEEYAKMDEFKALEELCVTGGKVEVIVNEQQRIYHEHLDKMLEQFEDILGKKNKLMEQLGVQFVQINQTLSSLAKLSTQMSQQVKKFNQSVSDDQIPSLEATFNIVAKSYEEWASRISFESKVVTKRLVPFYKYQKDNLDTLRSLLNTQSSFFKSYMKRSGSESSSQTYTSSSLKTHKNGILQESRNLTVLKYQLGFLGNMLCKESVRFFELMSDNFRSKWIYQADKYNERLAKDIQFYNSVSAMAR